MKFYCAIVLVLYHLSVAFLSFPAFLMIARELHMQLKTNAFPFFILKQRFGEEQRASMHKSSLNEEVVSLSFVSAIKNVYEESYLLTILTNEANCRQQVGASLFSVLF